MEYRKAQIPIILRSLVGRIPSRFNPIFGIRRINNKTSIRNFQSWDAVQQKQFIFRNLKQSVEFAYSNIPFYYDFYNRNNFEPSELNSFNDIRKIPVINKNILLEYPLEQRSLYVKGAVKVNTGGSSGHTLAFYRHSNEDNYHELIHMTAIWEKLGYRYSDLKLSMSGINAVKSGLDFCVKTNSLIIDTYLPFDKTAPILKNAAKFAPVRFLHGYPSILYEFAIYCENHDHQLRDLLRRSLKGAFLGSEYPHPMFRDTIEDVFGIDTVNWYGHTEGAVLAYEKDVKFKYHPFQTYGFAEVTEDGHLMASTYYNMAAPFIRYDTEDTISDIEKENGLLASFGIKDGRSGEYINDKNGKRISLTALIFGRHHKLFDFCTHIQICQMNQGQAIVLYVPRDKSIHFEPDSLFDDRKIEMAFVFKRLDHPIKTKSGKLNLLVKSDQLENNG